MLKLTFVDGTTVEFPFHSGSQLSVNTPDGVNGLKYGSWGEIAHLELVEPDAAPAAPAPVEAPVTLTADSGAQVVDVSVPQPEMPDNAAPEAPPVVTASAGGDPVVSAAPADVVANVAVLPLDDALTHIEAALVRWPDDPDLLAAHVDLLADEKPAA